MSASNLVDLAIELLNDAKTSTDAKSKVYYLEQVREIVIHRDPSILVGLIPDIMDFMIDTSAQVRKFLVQFCGEALKKSTMIAPFALRIFDFYASESIHDDFIRFIAQEFRSCYSQLFLYIVNLPIKTKSTDSSPDPKELYTQLRHVVNKIVEAVASNRSEITLIQCIRVIESVVQFGIPTGEKSKVVDPRLRGAKKKTEAATENSSSDIPLHHPFINRNEVEQEAEALFSKMLLWASRAGPQGYPFSGNQISQLGQSIAAISSTNHRLLNQATPAVVSILSKQELCESMSGQSREQLARSLHQMMRALMTQQDATSKSMVPKIKSSLQQLENLGFEDKNKGNDIKQESKKRSISSVVTEEGDIEDAELRTKALQALKSAEDSIAASSVNSGSDRDKFPGYQGGSQVNFSMSGETELPAGSFDFLDYSTNTRLGEVKSVPVVGLGGLTQEKVYIEAIPVAPSILQPVSQDSLLRILKGVGEVTNTKWGIRLVIRNAIALATIDLEAEQSGVAVSLVGSVSAHAFAAKMTDGLPMDINLPLSLLIVANFAMVQMMEGSKSTFPHSADLLRSLLLEVKSRWIVSSPDSRQFNLWSKIYESLCLLVCSRMLQNSQLRSTLSSTLLQLGSQPIACLKLFKLLMLTGTKSGGLRNECLNCLISFTMSSDKIAARASFNFLLWATLNDDFETRSKVIASLVSYLGQAKPSMQRYASIFAIQALVSVIGHSDCLSRLKSRGVAINEAEPLDIDTDSETTIATLSEALASYDGGRIFGGHFIVDSAAAPTSKFERIIKTHMQLTSQFCVALPPLIRAYFDVFGCGVFKFKQQQEVAPLTETDTTNESKLEAFKRLMTSDIRSILPAINNKQSTTQTFDSIMNSDSFSFPLVQLFVEVSHSDIHIPASPEIVEKMRHLVCIRHDIFERKLKNEGEVVTSDNDIDNIAYSNVQVLLFYIPVLSGFSELGIKSVLPYLVKSFCTVDTVETMKTALNRITQSRPSPISKSSLLAELHRINREKYNIEQKQIIQAVGICLDNKDEFRAEILKDCLSKLASDETLSEVVMRTAYIACMHHSELKSFTLLVLVPKIMSRNPWVNSQKVFDGIILIANKLFAHKDAAKMLRLVLALPPTQLKNVLTAATAASNTIKALYEGLVEPDRHVVLSGSLLDISLTPEEAMQWIEEKHLIIQEFSNAKPTTSTRVES